MDVVLSIGNHCEKIVISDSNERKEMEEPTEPKIEEECQKLKHNKSASANGIPAEVLISYLPLL